MITMLLFYFLRALLTRVHSCNLLLRIKLNIKQAIRRHSIFLLMEGRHLKAKFIILASEKVPFRKQKHCSVSESMLYLARHLPLPLMDCWNCGIGRINRGQKASFGHANTTRKKASCKLRTYLSITSVQGMKQNSEDKRVAEIEQET